MFNSNYVGIGKDEFRLLINFNLKGIKIEPEPIYWSFLMAGYGKNIWVKSGPRH